MTNKPPSSPAEPISDEMNLWQMCSIVWEIGYLIAIPAFAFGFAGAYLDRAQGTSPLLTIVGLFVALLVSCFAVYRKVKSVLL